MWKVCKNILFFSNERHDLKFDFQKWKQLHFWEENCLKYTHTHTKDVTLYVTFTFFLKQGQTRASSGPITLALKLSIIVLVIQSTYKEHFFVSFFIFSCSVVEVIGRMRTPVREAFSCGIRHGIRHIHCDSMKYDLMLHWITMNMPYPVP